MMSFPKMPSVLAAVALLLAPLMPVDAATKGPSEVNKCIVAKDGSIFNRCTEPVDIIYCGVAKSPSELVEPACPMTTSGTIAALQKGPRLLPGTTMTWSCPSRFRIKEGKVEFANGTFKSNGPTCLRNVDQKPEVVVEQNAEAAEGTASTAATATGVASRGAATTGQRMSAVECEAKKRAVIGTKIPPNASATSALQTVMWMTGTEIEMIDAGCPIEPGVTPEQIAQARKERVEQYMQAEKNCNQIQAGGRCSPAQYPVAAPGTTPTSARVQASPASKPAYYVQHAAAAAASAPPPSTPQGHTTTSPNTANAGGAPGKQARSHSVVRASPEDKKLRGVGGRPVEPATLYAHTALNLVMRDVGWVIATSPSEASKLAAEYGFSHLAATIKGGRAGEDYLALDFGWFAFIDSYEESAKYPGNLSRDGAMRIWAYAARSRGEAIRTAIGEYERLRGHSMAQLVYSGLVANFDRKGWTDRACSFCAPHMLYRRFCYIGGRPGPRDADYTNRNPRLVPAQFEGALCESNEGIPFMRAQEETVDPVLK